MHILVLNCGSSSVKFQIIETDRDKIDQDADRCLAQGIVERIGGHALLSFQAEGQNPVKLDEPLRDHRTTVERILRWVMSPDSKIDQIHSAADIEGIGHRVVHGGEAFRSSVRIDDEVLKGIEECIELAPLHNPANLRGIRAATEVFGPGVPQVAVFDTAFHADMPEESFLYGLPYHLYRRHKLRRYGFHGTSHRYVAYRYRRMLKLKREEVNIITLHLGNGCSACAIREGLSFDTSMGFTPLEGLLMGTRAGDLDSAVIEYLTHKEGMTLSEVSTMLNKHSGLLGISGLSGDMRDLVAEEEEHQDRRARLAINVFCQRVKKYVGAYVAVLDRADALIFTGGIGENSPPLRSRICDSLENLGIVLDEEANQRVRDGARGKISKADARMDVHVIPTNEELLIARDTYRVMDGIPMP
jgi:acetate kinase